MFSWSGAKNRDGENLFQMVFSDAQREERECLTLHVVWSCLTLIPTEGRKSVDKVVDKQEIVPTPREQTAHKKNKYGNV